MEPIVTIQNLEKSYGSFKALKGLNFEIPKGECLGLLGSNGAGKSTTIRIITGQLRPNAGEVRVSGFNPVVEAKKIHPLIGYIPDSQSLYEELSVFENIDLFRRLYLQSPEKTDDIIERIGLSHKKEERVLKLSKGLRQRVLIARALVHNPKIVLLDEPTSGLDPSSAESIYGILEDLKKQGATILLTTHLMNDVDRLCDRIVFVNEGLKVEEGTPAELKKKYSEPTLDVDILEDGHLIRKQIRKEGDWINQLQSLGDIQALHSHEPKLEEIFIHLVNQK